MINQKHRQRNVGYQDRALMERGVYGIGGFLRVSSELRILWSGPYLPRSQHVCARVQVEMPAVWEHRGTWILFHSATVPVSVCVCVCVCVSVCVFCILS